MINDNNFFFSGSTKVYLEKMKKKFIGGIDRHIGNNHLYDYANIAIQKWRQPLPINIKIINYGIMYINWDGLDPSDKCYFYEECIKNNIKCSIGYYNYGDNNYNNNIYCGYYKEPEKWFNIYYLLDLFFYFNLF
ncbi:hypothetical protein RFI_12685 [Reticulomyxa filosa]|uniref:Uncharacterized protein n=1 Tax=Reticulomyxa filosa TaxID=46433 RepID=X6NFF8_RETFI|nr:hypothetical protein RFI_12685 [Reticulomyxa filosa]|eukprot:ETO24469.1 hypothetical protein RFI_12685 [Reticulomyxa filosa]